MTEQSAFLSNHFLMATPYLEDPRFGGSLTYICEHDEEGAMGIIVNRPLELTLGDILEQLNLPGEARQHRVYAGGPVQTERGFVLHRPAGDWKNSLVVTERVALTTSRDILAAIGQEGGPEDFFLALGYAGWSAGQLEQELSGNAWLTCPADERILFDLPPEKRLHAALESLGVDPSHLSSRVGHA